MSEPQDSLEGKWGEICRLLLGQEVGPMSDLHGWLSRHPGPAHTLRSSVSGKEVVYAGRDYEGPILAALDELDFGRTWPPIGLGEIRDIAGLAAALRDRFCYAGNIVLGNSGYAERSSNITDCFFAFETVQQTGSKYLSQCGFGREDQALFGTYGTGESSFCISCSQLVKVTRSLEAITCNNCSDCYYSYGLENCSDCIFCFHLKNQRYCVGNLPLGKERYLEFKKRFVSELAQELREKKALPTLFDIAARCAPGAPPIPAGAADENSTDRTDRGRIEAEFTSAARILFGRPLAGLDAYGEWLNRHVHPRQERRSALSGRRSITCLGALFTMEAPPNRIVSAWEARQIGQRVRLTLPQAEGIRLRNAHERIGPLAYFNVDFWLGENANIIECVVMLDASDCYRSAAMVRSKLCAHSFWPVRSSACFGCDVVTDCACVMNCYRSKKLSRCFEVDCGRDCSDCYFCHNVENCQECMFCFNVKAKRYAIGNVEYKKEDYLRMKKLVLAEIAQKLERDKKLDWSIYNIGSVKP